MRTVVAALCLLPALAASAQEHEATAHVQLPLAVYDRMVEGARPAKPAERPAPARYALGNAQVDVQVEEQDGRFSGHVSVQLALRVLEDGWIAVPLLASGTALASARVDRQPVELLGTPAGLSWATSSAGSYQVELEYEVDARGSQLGGALAIPVPEAASLAFSAALPGRDLDVAVIPAAAIRSEQSDAGTQVSATVPGTGGIHLSWRLPAQGGHSLSRARYRGVLERDAVRFDAELAVELFQDESVTLPLLPTDVTLSELLLDGKPSAIAIEEQAFSARVRGRGLHRVRLAFELPVVHDEGPPHVDLRIPRVPVSELEISLPGDKEVSLEPAANVSAQRRGGITVSHAFLPMTDRVKLSWAEAVPEAVSEELLANANIFHLVHAEEGVLYVRAMVVYEVTSGHTNVLELDVPKDVQVSDIHAEGSAIKKAIKKRDEGRAQSDRYSVFLDRQLEGELAFDVFYERKLSAGEIAGQPIAIPVIHAAGVSRQRGMLALLASKELTLKPDPASEQGVTRVGENQLPPFVRQVVDKTIAHTYKYLETEPRLLVRPAPPERKQGRFDAQIDTLVSLSDVTLKGAATVEINVKSGSLEALTLRLPAGVNFLGLSAPSLRTHSVKDAGKQQLIDVQFTQQMEGQVRLEVSYEKITSEGEAKIAVPTLNVLGAEVEQGRIAVEALSAVEVGEAARDHLSPLDPNELPQQLVLKTTNPILRAYKYVQIDPPYRLALKVARHKEADVHQAAIDEGVYRTLYTRDGLAVTTARFSVRNSREQFLKIKLPRRSKVWSAFVAGRAEKPAIEEAEGAPPTVLIKVINSTEGFPVELIYETPVDPIGALGSVHGELPTPDMVVTSSRWEVYLPPGLSYGEPDSNMEQGEQGRTVAADAIKHALGSEGSASSAAEPLRIEVPSSGVRYAFSKIYANRSREPASFSVPYSSRSGAWLARLLAVLGTALFWGGLLLLAQPARRREGGVALVAGAALAALALGSFGAGIAWLLLSSLVLALALGIRWAIANRPRSSAS